MKKPLIFLSCFFLLIAYGLLPAFAADACCRGHGGVCGCQCCDGKALSKRCAEKRPDCPSGPAHEPRARKSSARTAGAHDACCRGHGGVCNCRCCDGKALSKRCAEKHSECQSESEGDAEAENEPDDSLLPPEELAQFDFSGELKRVTDGSDIVALRDEIPVKVRLAVVACPRMSQPFGQAARRFTVAALAKMPVSVKVAGIDKTGRLLGEVTTFGRKRLALELVRAGLAWWDRDSAPYEFELDALETEAQAIHAGLWFDEDPVPPWRWKKPKKI